MNPRANGFRINDSGDWRDSIMEVDEEKVEDEEEGDAFLAYIEHASSVLSPDTEDRESDGDGGEPNGPGWSWIASRILKTCLSYSSGVTSAILLSELSQAWSEQRRFGASKKMPECISQLKLKHRRTKLQNTVTIDSIHEKNFLSLNSVLEAVIVDVFVLPGTNIHMLSLGDFWSSNTIDLYLHRRYYNLVDPVHGILKKGREIFLTGCYLRSATAGCGRPRLLPTEYLIILLDQDQDDDAMLLAAQFCSDSFSSISLDAFSEGAAYSLYARIESIGGLEIQGNFGSLQRKQITLVDNDSVKRDFVLWGEQVILANLFSVGCMLALDKPFIASSVDRAAGAFDDLCLEYGSATQIYMVPFIQYEEQVCVALTQNRCQGTKLLSTFQPTQGPNVSQLTLPRDSRGSIDFSNYPFRLFVTDLHDKMTSISLYGVITEFLPERHTKEPVLFLKIEDSTGEIWAKLHFKGSWSLGRLGLGHTVYISGLSCVMAKQKRLEVHWLGNELGASLINISSLPALLNSSCLHQLSKLSDLTSQTTSTRICRVWLDQVEYVNTRYSHAACGHFVNDAPSGSLKCNFCHCDCNEELVLTFHLKVSLADDSTKVLAWCTGPTATELLQISPDEFYELPEEEQVMYPSSLDGERFVVAIVNCKQGRQPHQGPAPEDGVVWEITRAQKCE